MAMRRADGFDHWGNHNNMIQGGGYIEHNSSFDPTTNTPRTGAYAGFITNFGAGAGWVSDQVGGNQRTLIMGIGIWFGSIGGANNCHGIGIGDGDNNWQVSCAVSDDGSISVFNNRIGTFLGETAPGVVVPGTYNYIECKVFADTVNGSVEVHVNGISKLVLVNVNTNPQGTGFCNSTHWGKIQNGNTLDTRFDDYYCFDTTGANCNDFAGDVRCRTMFTTGDGPNQDWTPNNAPAWGELDNVPVDPANHFIGATTVGDVSDFTNTQLPTNTSFSYGLVTYANVQKSDAGACEVTPGISSNGTVATATPIAPGIGAAWYKGIFEVDPDTGVAWTLPALQAVLQRVERTV